MNQEWQIFLFGLIGTILASAITSGIAAFYLISNRVTKIETQMEMWLSKAAIFAAQFIHEDDNFHGQDEVLERLAASYREHGYDLPARDWVEARLACQVIMAHPDTPKDKRVIAGWLFDLCEHKLMRDRLT